MAFEKRTWFARLGLGLNKFIIGEKDAEGKQELTNAPDSVTQQGDVISADNLNDLEDRIEAGLNGMKLTQIWANETPSADFDNTDIDFSEVFDDIVVVTKESSSDNMLKFTHLKGNDNLNNAYISSIRILSSELLIKSRGVRIKNNVSATVKTRIRITLCRTFDMVENSGVWTQSISNTNGQLIPLYIYKVGDIYNS